MKFVEIGKGEQLTMDKSNIQKFLQHIGRVETGINPQIYLKAVRVTLHTLGFDDKWRIEVFEPELYKYFKNDIERYNKEHI